MASSPQAEALTQAHRSAQAKAALALAVLVIRRWRLTDPADPRSASQFVEFLIPQILRARGNSAGLAAAYYQAFRQIELGPSLESFIPQQMRDMEENILRTSLSVTGPIAYQGKIKAIGDVDPVQRKALEQQAFDEAGAQAAGAAIRHAQNGGRDTVVGAVKDDQRAIGYARVTKAHPCYFCAMLASRGAVYKKDSFQDSDTFFTGSFSTAKVHDSCQCSLEPTFSRTAALPGRGDEFATLWGSTTRGKSGRDAVNAFRRAYEQR